MKSIKEKQLLVKWARAMNEPVDPVLAEEVDRYNQLQQEIIESIRTNTINDLSDASKVADDIIKKVNIEYPKPPTFEELLGIIKEESNELVQAQAPQASPSTEEAPPPSTTREVVVEEKPDSLISRAVEHIHKEVKLEENSFQQPNPSLVDKNIEAVQKKLKFLEQAIGKIAAHGPAGGDGNPFDKVEFMERGVRFTPTPRMMYWNNVEDCVNITQADGSTLQVGLENYIRVYNNTANTFTNGTFIEFRGVDAEGDAPTFRAFVNDANAQPLYSIGVLTNDVTSNTHGRATVLGLVRDIDTTGSAVGETWSIGDVLWANPTYPGKFTKVKPTSPNVSISVAAVISSGVTDGAILVRPAIWPRLRYGDFYSAAVQVAPAPNQDVRLAITDKLIASGFTLSGNTIIALDSGLYKFHCRVQLTSSSSSTKSIILWYKKNGVNIPYSSVRQSISENNGYVTISNFQVISMDANDNVSVHFTVTDTTLTVDSPAIFDGAPNIPSIQLAITEAAL